MIRAVLPISLYVWLLNLASYNKHQHKLAGSNFRAVMPPRSSLHPCLVQAWSCACELSLQAVRGMPFRDTMWFVSEDSGGRTVIGLSPTVTSQFPFHWAQFGWMHSLLSALLALLAYFVGSGCPGYLILAPARTGIRVWASTSLRASGVLYDSCTSLAVKPLFGIEASKSVYCGWILRTLPESLDTTMQLVWLVSSCSSIASQIRFYEIL